MERIDQMLIAKTIIENPYFFNNLTTLHYTLRRLNYYKICQHIDKKSAQQQVFGFVPVAIGLEPRLKIELQEMGFSQPNALEQFLDFLGAWRFLPLHKK